MSVLAVRSVGLSTTTKNAWRAAHVTFARRGRTTDEIMEMGYDEVLNLGKSSFRPTIGVERVWNHGRDIIPLLTPGDTRNHFPVGFLPPKPDTFPANVWVKAPGSHGRGKNLVVIEQPLVLPPRWDWQEHISGQEYRLITVGNLLVQDFLRHGDNSNRSYQWVPMREVPNELKTLVKRAASALPGNNVIAWDTVMSDEYDRPFILEGNTCPGVNEATAQRIVSAMYKIREEQS